MPKVILKTVLPRVAGMLLTLEMIWTEDTVILGWMASLGDLYRVRHAVTILSWVQKLMHIRGFVMGTIHMHIS